MSVTIYDIAKKCNCSTTTVSKVFNNHGNISKKKKAEILKAAEELGYMKSLSAAALARNDKSNRLIGVILHINENKSITHELFSQILNSFRTCIEQEDYDICFMRNVSDDSPYSYSNFVRSRGMDGIFVLSADIGNKKVSELFESNVPIVTFDIPSSEYGVSSNNRESVTNLVDYLCKLGHKKICYVKPKDVGISEQLFEGFVDGLKKNDIKFENDMVVHGPFYKDGSAKMITDSILNSGFNPSVIMYPDDYTAVSALSYLKSIGKKVPEDISITGFDGVELAEFMSPNIVTIRQNTIELGRHAAELLLDLINKKEIVNKRIVVKSTLIKGHSVKEMKTEE